MSIWDADRVTERQLMIDEILTKADGPMHMAELARRITESAGEPFPARYTADRRAFHDSGYRRTLTDDLHDISLSEAFPATFVGSGNRGVYKCTDEELARKAARRTVAGKKAMAEARILLMKAGVKDNMRLEELIHA